MDLSMAIGLADGIRKTAKAISEIKNDLLDATERKELQDIRDGLHSIYFVPRAIVSVLEKIDDGEPIAEDDVKKLVDFNQGQEQVKKSIARLNDNFGSQSVFSIRENRILQDIAYKKSFLRIEIQHAFNEVLTFGEGPDPVKAAKALKGIAALNAAIEEMEEIVLQRLSQ